MWSNICAKLLNWSYLSRLDHASVSFYIRSFTCLYQALLFIIKLIVFYFWNFGFTFLTLWCGCDMAMPCIHHPNLCLTPTVHYLLSCRAHPRSGSVQTSPTSTPMSGRRGRQLPQLPPTGKDRSKSTWFFFFLHALQDLSRDLKTCLLSKHILILVQ